MDLPSTPGPCSLHHRLAWASLSPMSLRCVLQSVCICFVLAHRPTVYATGLLRTCFSSPLPPSASRALSALVSPQQAYPLCHGVSVLFFQLPRSALSDTFCVRWRGLYASPSTPAHPLHHGASEGFSWSPEPTIWLGPQSVSCLWAEKCSFLGRLSPCFAWFSKILQQPRGPTCEKASQCTEAPPASQLTPFHGAQAHIQKFFVFSLFMSPSSLLPHSRKFSLPLWDLGSAPVT